MKRNKSSNAHDDSRRAPVKRSTHSASFTSALGRRGFTFIEILITLTLIAICFVPLMRMYSVSVDQAHAATEMTIARYLAQEGMERLKNLGFTESQIALIGDIWEPPLRQPSLNVSGQRWRVLREVVKETDPLEVRVQVYQISGASNERPTHKPLVELITLIEDLDWAVVEEAY